MHRGVEVGTSKAVSNGLAVGVGLIVSCSLLHRFVVVNVVISLLNWFSLLLCLIWDCQKFFLF